MTSLMALEGIRAMIAALPRLKADAADPGAWAEAHYGAWLCGTVLGQVGMSIHHKLCHALGGGFNLPHADTHAILLPHAISPVEPAVPELLATVAELLGSNTAALGLQDLARSLGAPTRLGEIGLTETDLDRAVTLATARPYWSTRPIDAKTMLPLLRRALAGAPGASAFHPASAGVSDPDHPHLRPALPLYHLGRGVRRQGKSAGRFSAGGRPRQGRLTWLQRGLVLGG